MTFVGPRPEDPGFIEHYPEKFKGILDFTPGITSPASITYRNESSALTGEHHERDYIEHILHDKLSIDYEYFTTSSPRRHIAVLLRTVLSCIKSKKLNVKC